MNPYVKKVKSIENYCLILWFDNEEQKIFDLKPYFSDPKRIVKKHRTFSDQGG